MFDIRRLEDINLNEVILKQDYYNYFLNNNIDEAKQLIKKNPQLNNKVLNAENLNKIVKYIMNLENNCYNNIDNVLKNHISDYQIEIDDLIYLQKYNNSKQYEINNFVSYNNEIYFCIKRPNIGTSPTNNLYWLYLGLRGEKADYDLGVNYKGNWTNINYNKFDMVSFENKLYVAKRANINKQPNINSNDWSLQVSLKSSKITISREKPLQEKNEIWIQIL